MKKVFASRKMMLAMIAMAIGTGFVLADKLDAKEYLQFVGGVTAITIGAIAGEDVADKKANRNETP